MFVGVDLFCLWEGGGVKFFWFVCFVFNIVEFLDKERGWGWGVDFFIIILYFNYFLILIYR